MADEGILTLWRQERMQPPFRPCEGRKEEEEEEEKQLNSEVKKEFLKKDAMGSVWGEGVGWGQLGCIVGQKLSPPPLLSFLPPVYNKEL